MPGSDLTPVLVLPDDNTVRLREATVLEWDTSTGANVLDLGDGATWTDVPHVTFRYGVAGYEPGDVVLLLVWGRVAVILGTAGLVPPGSPPTAIVSGEWQYATQTSGPAATGQIRTRFDAGTLPGATGDVWLSHTDADGLDWSTSVSVLEGDGLTLRDPDGQTLILRVDTVFTNGTGVRLSTTVTGGSAVAPKKNTRVRVTLSRRA